ncbi:ABC transporter permease [Bacteroidia bacterium]|nr:ABC transporter permease [Bacteroidia bacterium]GHV45532.1 ABC transporter permease [Bacteroidia bacterium]
MFDFDSIHETFATIGRNKLRTILTGVAVAWGILMLIILLAAGNGLKNGITSNFSNRAQNSVTLWAGWTSVPYNGMPSDRQIKFDQLDYDLILNKTPEAEFVSPHISQNVIISYGIEYGAFQLHSVTPDAAQINNIKIDANNGRFINKLDNDNRRKVIVISPDIAKILFKNENPIGKFVDAGGIMLQIIGIYDNTDRFSDNPPAYIPFSTGQLLYNRGWGFHEITFTTKGLNSLNDNKLFVERLRKRFAKLHNFDPADRSALYIHDMAETVAETNMIFSSIQFFIWIIGLASMMAGIVGVGNIMLITVKERTREIGIRKAIGAKPASVLQMIILESIIITTIAGYAGLMLGILITEIVNNLMGGEQTADTPSMFKDPTVNLGIVFGATLVLIVAGVIAGLIPALKAVKVRPIEAMRAE